MRVANVLTALIIMALLGSVPLSADTKEDDLKSPSKSFTITSALLKPILKELRSWSDLGIDVDHAKIEADRIHLRGTSRSPDAAKDAIKRLEDRDDFAAILESGNVQLTSKVEIDSSDVVRFDIRVVARVAEEEEVRAKPKPDESVVEKIRHAYIASGAYSKFVAREFFIRDYKSVRHLARQLKFRKVRAWNFLAGAHNVIHKPLAAIEVLTFTWRAESRVPTEIRSPLEPSWLVGRGTVESLEKIDPLRLRGPSRDALSIGTQPDEDDVPAKLVELRLQFPAHYRSEVLRILENEDAIAIDPQSGKSVVAPPMDPIAPSISALPLISAVLKHAGRMKLGLDEIDLKASSPTSVQLDSRGELLFRLPRGSTKVDRQRAIDVLMEALRNDSHLDDGARGIEVRAGAYIPDDGMQIRVSFYQREGTEPEPPAPGAGPSQSTPVESIVDSARTTKGSVKVTFHGKDRVSKHRLWSARLVERDATVEIDANRPANLLSFLEEQEQSEQVAVVHLRYKRLLADEACGVIAGEPGVARVTFAARHKWLPSDQLRLLMLTPTPDWIHRPVELPFSSSSVLIRAREGRVHVLARLFAKSIALGSGCVLTRSVDGAYVAPRSPESISSSLVTSSSIELVVGAFVKEEVSLTGIELDAAAGTVTVSYSHHLDRAELENKDAPVSSQSARDHEYTAWRGFEQQKQVRSVWVRRVEVVDLPDPSRIRIDATVRIALRNSDESSRVLVLRSHSEPDARLIIQALVRRRGWEVDKDERKGEKTNYAYGTRTVTRRILLKSKAIAIGDLTLFVSAVEQLKGYSVDSVHWSNTGATEMELTCTSALWEFE